MNARQEEQHFMPLHEAALNGDLELARLLIDRGAKINGRTKDGKTPLGFALEHNQEEMVAFLRERGALP